MGNPIEYPDGRERRSVNNDWKKKERQTDKTNIDKIDNLRRLLNCAEKSQK
jgi:hypothetical protein